MAENPSSCGSWQAGANVRGRSAQDVYGLDSPAAGDPAAISAWPRAGTETPLDHYLGELPVPDAGSPEAEGGENPHLTVCQVHIAAAELARSWRLNGALCTALIEEAVNTIRHWQQRLAAARESHIKQTRTPCNWP